MPAQITNSGVKMADFLNPRGRILLFEDEYFLHDLPEAYATLAFGLASQAQLDALDGAPISASELEDNPPLELWLDKKLVGICDLIVGADTASELEVLEPGESDDLYYSAEFKQIWLDESLRGHGLGLLMTQAAAQYAASRIAEDLVVRERAEAVVMFYATIVSSRGDELYGAFMNTIEHQLDLIGEHMGKTLSYFNEGGW